MTNHERDNTARLDVNNQRSQRKGFAGFFESALRRFSSILQALMMLPLYGLASLCGGVALVPGFYLFNWVSEATTHWPKAGHFFAAGSAIVTSYFLFGFTLLFLLPLVNFVLRGYLSPWRGPYYSLEAIRWYIHNGAVYLLRYSFLEFLTPSPFLNLFYQMMGMKIGRGTVINSTHISDPSLIELGARVTIGGSATIVGHYGQGGYLVLARVVIGDNVTIGLKATIMGGVTIGKGAKILPHSAVLPKTQIPEGETWGGIPAQKVSIISRKAAA